MTFSIVCQMDVGNVKAQPMKSTKHECGGLYLPCIVVISAVGVYRFENSTKIIRLENRDKMILICQSKQIFRMNRAFGKLIFPLWFGLVWYVNISMGKIDGISYGFNTCHAHYMSCLCSFFSFFSLNAFLIHLHSPSVSKTYLYWINVSIICGSQIDSQMCCFSSFFFFPFSSFLLDLGRTYIRAFKIENLLHRLYRLMNDF